MMNDWHGSMMGGMWFFSILFWGLIIAGVVFMVRWMRKRGQEQKESSLDILKRRYANGEIDRDAFEQMKKDLKGNGS